MSGRLYGIGLGPGDPELVTLKALRLLRAADLVAYLAPVGGDSFARNIVAQWLDAGQEELRIEVPMAADAEAAIPAYDEAARQLSRYLRDGRRIAVLCQGDPFFYGSFMYLFTRLSEVAPIEIVPGVSSINAAAAELHLPLVSRNEVLIVVPATLAEEDLEARLRDCEAAAIVKLGRHFSKVDRVLARLCLQQRARYIERATLPNQRVIDLADVVSSEIPYFSMILIAGDGRGR